WHVETDADARATLDLDVAWVLGQVRKGLPADQNDPRRRLIIAVDDNGPTERRQRASKLDARRIKRQPKSNVVRFPQQRGRIAVGGVDRFAQRAASVAHAVVGVTTHGYRERRAWHHQWRRRQ